jgi:MFS family permease
LDQTLRSRAVSFARERRMPLITLLFMCSIYFFSYFHRVAVPGTIFDELQTDFKMSAGEVAWLGALFLYIYAGMQLVAGLLNDRFGAAKVLLAGGSLLTLGAILFPLAQTPPPLYAARALVALGASLIFLSVVKALDSLFGSKYFAPLLGVVLFLGYSGGLAGTYPFERAAHAFGWRHALLGAGVVCTVCLFLVGWLLHATGQLRRTEKTASPFILKDIIQNRQSIPVLLSGSVNWAVYFLIQATVGKKLLTDYGHLAPSKAASFTFAMMLGAMSASLLSGFVSRALGNRRKPIMLCGTGITFFTLLALCVTLHFNLGAAWFLPCYILLAVSAGSSPIFCTSMKELNPEEAAATSVGLLNGTCYLTIAIVTNLAGYIMDGFQEQAIHTETALIYPPAAYLTIFAILLGVALCSFVSTFFIRESYGACVYLKGD